MANRIAKAEDISLYGNYITPGDLIIDSPTRTFEDGSKEVSYYFMVKEWPTLREGAVIWLDGEKLGFVNKYQFRNTSNGQTGWLIKSASIKNIPNTKVVCGAITSHGLVNLHISGVCEKYKGLLEWPYSRKFLTGNFGIHVKNLNMTGGHGIELSTLNGGSIKLDGFEIQFGFSGVRLYSSAVDIFVESIDISNFYIHDTGGGEGFYIGSTQSGAKAKLRNLKIKNGIVARTAAESLQLQHMIGGADVADIVIYGSDMDYLHAFQPYQDTGMQWVVSSGVNKLSNVILDGFASQGLAVYGSGEDPTNAPNGVSLVENVLLNDGRNQGQYLHNSAKMGITWKYKNVYFRGFNNSYADGTGEKKIPYIISNRHGTDPVHYERIIHDGSKERVFEDTRDFLATEIGEVILDKALPAPKYINSGFGETPVSKIKVWHQTYGKYFDGPDNTPTIWKYDDIAIDSREDGTYVFCKCIQDHVTKTGATVIRPKESEQFLTLTWDENGIRNDKAGHNPNTVQSFFPPDDLRLADDCYWKAKGFGVKGIVTTTEPEPEPIPNEPEPEKEIIVEQYVMNNEMIFVTSKGKYKHGVVKI